jgi:hypothetical protein
MAASDTELFFELNESVFVDSAESPSPTTSPAFTAGDVTPILLKLLRRTAADSVEVVDLTGVTVQIAIGTPGASPTVLTSATSGTVDGLGFLPITLPFNVAAVTGAFGGALEIYPYLEIRVVFGTTPQRFQTTCTIRQWLITATLQDPAAPGVATTLAEVLSLCVPRNGSDTSYPCSSFIMVDEDDTTKVYRGVLRAGELHFEQIA